jgi:hypothetical protein
MSWWTIWKGFNTLGKQITVLFHWCDSIMQNMPLVRQVFVISNEVQSWYLNPSFRTSTHWLFQMKLLCSSHLNLCRGSIFFAAQVTPVARKRAFTVSVHVFVQCWLPSKKLATSWTVVMLLVNKVNTCNNTTYKFLRFSQQRGSGLRSSRGWCCVNGWLVPSVSKEHSVCLWMPTSNPWRQRQYAPSTHWSLTPGTVFLQNVWNSDVPSYPRTPQA